MSNVHIEGMVRTRLDAFSNSFLSRLGPEVLRILYEEVCSSDHFCGYVYLNNSNQVCGFIFASLADGSSFNRQVIRKRWDVLSFFIIKRFLYHPRLSVEIFRRLMSLLKDSLKGFLGSRSGIQNREGSPVSAGIPGVMLTPEYHGKGIAKELIQALLKDLKDKDIKEVCLSTGVDNMGANRFYQKMGFELIDTYIEYGGIKQNRYRLCL